MTEANVSTMSKHVAEFLGTFMLVFTIALVAGQALSVKEVGVYGPFAIGSMLTVMIYTLGRISGGYFNPAITFAAAYQHVLHWDLAFSYMIAQFAGGVCGALMNRALFGFDKLYNPHVGPPDAALHFSGFDMLQCPLIEFVYTFMLTFVALNVQIHTPSGKSSVEREYAGLTIGFVILCGGYGAGRVSGGFFNPAASLGIDIAHLINPQKASFLYSGLYAAAQFGGAFLSVTALHLVRKETRPDGAGHPWYHPLNLALKIESYCLPELSCEFIGTYFLTFTFGCNIMANDWHSKHPTVPISPVCLSMGAAYMVMIYAIGDISHGGHFNPAVTLSIFFSGRKKEFFPLLRVAEYMVAQLLAGAAGAASYWLCFTFSDTKDHISVVAVHPPEGVPGVSGMLQPFLAEMLMTFLLCYVTLCVANGPEQLKSYYGFAIGSTIIAGGVALGSLTNGFINPAITLGSALMSFPVFLENYSWILYVLGQAAGAGLAAAIAKYVTHPTEYDESHTFSEQLLGSS